MRIEVKKFLFLGPEEAQNRFLEAAQREGIMQFISVTGQKKHHPSKYIINLQLAINALKRQQVSHEHRTISYEQAGALVEKILETKREIENLHEEIRLLGLEIVKVHPLGEFNLDHISDLRLKTGRLFRFYFARHDRIASEKIPEDLLFINREFDFDYFLYVGKKPLSHPFFTEIELTKPLSKLIEEQKKLHALSHEKEDEMRGYAAYIDSLYDHLLLKMNEVHLDFAKEDVDFYLDHMLFAIEAWIPENKVDLIQPLIQDLPLHVHEVKIEPEDKVPTYLENKGYNRMGQDLVEVYDTPSITDPDPSPWVICFFTLFFGMIVADAGYGFLFFLAALFLRFKYPKIHGIKRRMLKLFTLLSCACMVWGVLVGSYFSIKMEPSNPLNQITILYNLAVAKVDYAIQHHSASHQEWLKEFPNNRNIMDPSEFIARAIEVKAGNTTFALMENLYDSILLEIAILVGVIHISLSFLRNIRRSWASIGWVIMIWGGFLYFPKILDSNTMVNYLGILSAETSFAVGEIMLYGGFAIALILSLWQSRWTGILAAFKVIEIFADTLSYLRLYALGLASMVMASTFNSLGMSAGYGLGFIIIFLGHAVNITLAVMAGVIHGLRLNFLEWYHHSFEGGGKKFNPLRLLKREK